MAYKIVALRSNVLTPEGKKYQVCEFAYKTDEGKVKAMRIFGFGDQKGNFDAASKAANNDVFEVEFQQNAKGYWEFVPNSLKSTGVKEASAASGATPEKASASTNTSRGNWETPEERAARQVMIVRQSQLSNAIAYFELIKNTKATEKDVVDIARYFESYVLSPKEEVTGDVE